MAHIEEASLQLWYDLEEGDPYARNTLILHYQPLVLGMARKLKSKLPSWIMDEDLISYGQIGLIRAVDRYDYRQGPFSSFASTYVHGAILDELRSQDWAPRGLRRDQRLIGEAISDIRSEEGDLDKDPTNHQIAENLGWSTHRVESTLKKVSNAVPVQYDHAPEVFNHSESDSVDSSVSANSMCGLFVKIFKNLPQATQIVLVHRYFLNETMSVVSERVGMPSAVVRQIHAEAVSLILREMTSSVS